MDMDLPFLSAMLLIVPPSLDLWNAFFIHQESISYITSDETTHFTAKGESQQAHAHVIHWLYHVSQHSETAGPREQ